MSAIVIRVLQYGFGSVGRWTVPMVMRRSGLRLVGVIDSQPGLVDLDPGEFVGAGKTGLRIAPALKLLGQVHAEVVLHSTVTSMDAVWDQIRPCVESGMSVITTAEEMIYPWRTHSALATEIDRCAKNSGVAVVATGINPGFAMDLVPLVLCSATDRVDKVTVKRVVDFAEYPNFRAPYMGFGMSPEVFTKSVSDGRWSLGRNPFPGRLENIHLIADCLGWDIDKITIAYKPLVSKSRRPTLWGFEIEPGQVAGVLQLATVVVDGEERIRLECTAVCHSRPEEDGIEPGNIVQIDGEPSHNMRLTGGTVERGGYVTGARQVNLIPLVLSASPGLLTMRDLSSMPGPIVATM